MMDSICSSWVQWGSLLLSPEDQVVEFLALSPEPCLPEGHSASHHDNNELNLGDLS